MRRLRDEIVCLHCWTRFPVEDVMWQSEHRDLLGDPLLGEDAQLRFLPSRFDLSGNAIDAKGQTCQELACPKCHLAIPRALLDREPVFVSILGTPSCGKSYYLGALATTLRRELPAQFGIGFTDADTVSNQPLTRYEEHMFVNENGDKYVFLADLIPKTQMHGDLYYTVRYGEQTVIYPRAFSFLLEPLRNHPNFAQGHQAQRVVSLYDNAGEHFLAGQDSTSAPGTRHLAESSFLLFLFDPTQDPRWHAAMRKANPTLKMPRTQHAGRQEGVLREAAIRVRKLLGLADAVLHNRPLIVILNKVDVWRSMLSPNDLDSVLSTSQYGIASVDLAKVAQRSNCLGQLLRDHIPEIVYAAESFCDTVYYLPASALGNPPQFDNEGHARVKPADIVPTGVTIPFLLGFALTTKGLIPATTEQREASSHSTEHDGSYSHVYKR